MRGNAKFAQDNGSIPGGKGRKLIASIRVGLMSGVMLLALLVLSVPRVAESLGLKPPPGLVSVAQLGPSVPAWSQHPNESGR
ncbi:hypothetical protein [Hypericibacter sp.]|uniref:hypothetical protein n=1 Tax=Hypericibacter sp. TaxID=2705401 RepID=UPI003D6C7FD1